MKLSTDAERESAINRLCSLMRESRDTWLRIEGQTVRLNIPDLYADLGVEPDDVLTAMVIHCVTRAIGQRYGARPNVRWEPLN